LRENKRWSPGNTIQYGWMDIRSPAKKNEVEQIL